MPSDTVPVAIMAFNRPDYLGQVFASLRAQELAGCRTRFSFHLFQDGAVNRYSGAPYADPADIAACIAIARAEMPSIDLHVSPDNVGVAEMFAAAETFVFDELKAGYAIFLEDDMTLDRRYLCTMARIRDHAAPHEEIGVFAAYGDHRVDPARIPALLAQPQRWMPLGHQWAFAATAVHRRAIDPIMERYRRIVHGRDYRLRDHTAIRRLFQDLGTSTLDTSQDAAKTAAAFLTSRLRLNIELPLGRYIGEHGLHFHPELFRELGYDRPMTDIPEGEVMLAEITTEDLARLHRETAQRAAAQRAPPARQSGLRLLTRDDVRDLYRLLLGREPEEEGVFENAVGRMTLSELRNAIINSAEYRAAN
jgi:hypothetical protein